MEFHRGKRLNVDGSVEMDSFFTLDWNFECSSHIIWLHFRCNTKITIISFLELIVKCMVSSYLIESYSNRTELCYFQINARNIIFFYVSFIRFVEKHEKKICLDYNFSQLDDWSFIYL